MKYTASKNEIISLFLKVINLIDSKTEIDSCNIRINGCVIELNQINQSHISLRSNERNTVEEEFQSQLVEANIKPSEYLHIFIGLTKESQDFFEIYSDKINDSLINEIAVYKRDNL